MTPRPLAVGEEPPPPMDTTDEINRKASEPSRAKGKLWGLMIARPYAIIIPYEKKRPAPITDLLRQTIIASKIPLLTLEQKTGVQRASIGRFIKGKNSLRLDIADKLAQFFGLALQPIRKKKGRRNDGPARNHENRE